MMIEKEMGKIAVIGTEAMAIGRATRKEVNQVTQYSTAGKNVECNN